MLSLLLKRIDINSHSLTIVIFVDCGSKIKNGFVLNVCKGFKKCQFLPLTCPVEIIRSMIADHGLKGDKVF